MKIKNKNSRHPKSIKSNHFIKNEIEEMEDDGEESGVPIYQKGGVGILEINGVLTAEPEYDLFGQCSCSYSEIQHKLEMLKNNEGIFSVILCINSSGGDSTGTAEIFNYITKYNKPIYAYAKGICASAAYHIAVACDEVVASRDALVGSIGSMLCLRDDEAFYESMGIVDTTLVNEDSPLKVADLNDSEGLQQYQKLVDYAGSTFIEDVASRRGIPATSEAIGHGAILTPPDAKRLNLIDRIENYNTYFREVMNMRTIRTTSTTAPQNLKTPEMAISNKIEKQIKPMEVSRVEEIKEKTLFSSPLQQTTALAPVQTAPAPAPAPQQASAPAPAPQQAPALVQQAPVPAPAPTTTEAPAPAQQLNTKEKVASDYELKEHERRSKINSLEASAEFKLQMILGGVSVEEAKTNLMKQSQEAILMKQKSDVIDAQKMTEIQPTVTDEVKLEDNQVQSRSKKEALIKSMIDHGSNQPILIN